MRYLTIFVMVFSIFLCSCISKYEDKRAKSFIALKNGEEISHDDYDSLRRTCGEVSGILRFKGILKNDTGKVFSEQEIRDIVFSNDLKVVLRKKVGNTTTEPKGQ